MAGFKFKLQPVLEMREREEREKKLALADLERERMWIENRIRGYQRNIETEQSSLAQMLGTQGGVDLRGARLQANAAVSNRFSAQRAVLELAGVHHQIERARTELAEASTRRKAVELLRDRQQEAFELEQRRRESIEMDDMSVMRYSRGQGTLR
ncbi:MAG: flagellar export protein FliJ [Phycisphaerales bacterium]|nr:flagellar export protein FliJ [Phycisphaerales bacterium]